MDCAAGTKKPRDIDAILARFGIKGVDLDPVVQILVRRTMALRRCLAKRPENEELVKEMMKRYSSEQPAEGDAMWASREAAVPQGSGDRTASGTAARGTGPAPHPMQMSRSKWMKKTFPR